MWELQSAVMLPKHISHVHTHEHTHTHTQQLLNSLKFCSQSIIAGQMPLFIQVTFSPHGLKDSLHKMSELPTSLTVLKANYYIYKGSNFFYITQPNAYITKYHSFNKYLLSSMARCCPRCHGCNSKNTVCTLRELIIQWEKTHRQIMCKYRGLWMYLISLGASRKCI